MRLPTNAQRLAFCEHDHWTPKKQTDHWRFTKEINGKTWRTKVSFGADQLGDPGLFSDILRDQLNVDAAEFWRVVDQKVPAQRPTPVVPEPARVLPAWLVSGLIKEGVLESHIATLDEDAARALLNDLRSQERR